MSLPGSVSAAANKEPNGLADRVTVVCHHHREGRRSSVPIDQIKGLIDDPTWSTWVDLAHAELADLEFLRETFDLHPLVMEDLVNRQQRPKIDQYDNFRFLVVYAGAPDPVDHVALHELHMCVGRNYLVTTHTEEIPEVRRALARWSEAINDISDSETFARANGIEVALYILFDTIVDGYFPIVDGFADALDDLEERVFTGTDDQRTVAGLFQLRKRLFALRRVLGGERDVVNVFARREMDHENVGTSRYYLDVYDHLNRLVEDIDIHRDTITAVLDAHISAVSNRLNQTMKTMTALATILMTCALITGVYGMNFDFMPELHWEYGYAMALGLVVGVAATLGWYFRRIDWL